MDVIVRRTTTSMTRSTSGASGDAYQWFKDGMEQHLPNANVRLNLYLASKDLERIADHACNIAEDVIYLVSGEIVRHHDLPLAEDETRRDRFKR